MWFINTMNMARQHMRDRHMNHVTLCWWTTFIHEPHLLMNHIYSWTTFNSPPHVKSPHESCISERLKVTFWKRAIVGLFCGKWPIKIRHLHESCISERLHVSFRKNAIVGLFCGKWPIKIRLLQHTQYVYTYTLVSVRYRVCCSVLLQRVVVVCCCSVLQCYCSMLQCGAVEIQGGEDPWDALSCRSFFAKEPRIIGLFCKKMTYEDKAPFDSTPPCITLVKLNL